MSNDHLKHRPGFNHRHVKFPNGRHVHLKPRTVDRGDAGLVDYEFECRTCGFHSRHIQCPYERYFYITDVNTNSDSERSHLHQEL